MASPYSCDPTGTIDCAAAIEQIKANQSNVGTIYFPHGTWRIATNLTIPNGMHIVGEKGANIVYSAVLTISGTIDDVVTFTKSGSGTLSFGSNIDKVNTSSFGTPSWANLQNAATAVNASGHKLLVTAGTWPVSDNLEITSLVGSVPTSLLQVATTKTLTLASVDAGRHQMFALVGTGKVAGLKEAKVEWFATLATAINNSNAALTYTTLNAAGGTHAITNQTITPYVRLEGIGHVILQDTAVTGDPSLLFTGVTSLDDAWNWSKFDLQGNTSSGSGVKLDNAVLLGLQDFQIRETGGSGLELTNLCHYNKFEKFIIDNCPGGGIKLYQANDNTFIHGRVSRCGTAVIPAIQILDTTSIIEFLGGDWENNLNAMTLYVYNTGGIAIRGIYMEGNAVGLTYSQHLLNAFDVLYENCNLGDESPIRIENSQGVKFRGNVIGGRILIEADSSDIEIIGNAIYSTKPIIDKSFCNYYARNYVHPSYETLRAIAFPVNPGSMPFRNKGHNVFEDSTFRTVALTDVGTATTAVTTDGHYSPTCNNIFIPSGSGHGVYARTTQYAVPDGSTMVVSVSLKADVPGLYTLFAYYAGGSLGAAGPVWVDTNWRRYSFKFARNGTGVSKDVQIWFYAEEAPVGDVNLRVSDLNIEVVPYDDSGWRLDNPVYIRTYGQAETSDTTPDRWVDYFTLSTINGFVAPTGTIFFRVNDQGGQKQVDVMFDISGTSNATNFNFTLPVTGLTGGPTQTSLSLRALDNGSWQAGPGMIGMSAGSSTIGLTRDGTALAWTNSGNKQGRGIFSFAAN
jgi:hypothetical protein